MVKVKLKDFEDFSHLLRRFKKACEQSGVMSEMKRYQAYEKPSDRKRREKMQRRREHLKRLAETQEF
jgi:small subunit ribosomal protein S21